ncbi:lipase family protein [Kibdelosporangium philippinense]|uniref:Lipase family protein n=1 Tax=Kibdelosporangium philippinense TaxID=211113 RepID=A0ABS8ZXG9_9PSEU|nr:alpha/beta fold hydrolase [Kibdelosporangium philippinense]MCE7011860.1 lipase family protein [Kibdelosporangium philippinense]
MRPALLGSVAVVLALALLSPSAAADQKYPVSYGVAGLAKAAEAQLTRPGSAPPGANNFSCKPSAAHPDPVVLVHGASANMTANWQTISPLLKNNGYCVFALTYGVPAGTPFPINQIGGRNPMEQSAVELSAFVDRVLAATGARKVDIVGHSEGSLMPNYYVKFLGGGAKVSDYVGLTPLWSGSNVANLANFYSLARMFGLGPVVDQLVDAVFPAARQFLRGSDFLAKMAEGGVAHPSVKYTTIMTKYDEAVVPYSSGYLKTPNATDVVLQNLCPQDYAGHGMVAFDPNATQVILNALDPANAKPVRCHFVPVSP